MNTSISSPDEVIKLVTTLCKNHGVSSVTLFGSRATGKAVERSDIDIAVTGDSVDLISLENKIEELPTLFAVNIVDFDKCSESLRKDIELYGKLLHKA
ncbi:MAG: nucleotidyltransferase domain-containing protein [Oscillospiraceae bacterium]|nr:nucleotidyltransferase domain-containing protein [Oscillospiraceae bacterium]